MKKLNPALVLSVSIVAIFSVMLAMEVQGASDTDSVTLSVTVAQTISIDCGSDVDLGSLTPGSPVYASSTCTVTTNADVGYDLKVQRDDADTTMDKTDDASTNITDKTVWDPTANGGDGNASTWSGTGLGFSVYESSATKDETWWGTGTACDDALNQYAGFPTSYATIMDHDSYESSSTTTGVCYKVDTPTTQRAGTYDGTITFQAVGKP